VSERLFYRNEKLDTSTYRDPGEVKISSKDNANLIGSMCGDGMHRPVLDLDIPVTVVPSSTEGHAHLYIDKEMSFDTMIAFIDALASAGIVERSWAKAVRSRGMTLVRPPWVKKPVAEPKQLPAPATQTDEVF
jgi:hypothetical protein